VPVAAVAVAVGRQVLTWLGSDAGWGRGHRLASKKLKRKDIAPVDHSKISYEVRSAGSDGTTVRVGAAG